ncbi:25.3 kDa vesicle transport protein isoform X2 [Juglans microcarpa x Juglans regia]|uniref:25.3 kDa vesicle transport protein isoform X2 n=1 Tax=Juglans microcarpa x Juglans regia TaxID=2249226 RepID=UPI001B7E6713|nr:25.3 kDa vesicle transport protein isoform X2 [Juglans microcarpa x Juglans regia]
MIISWEMVKLTIVGRVRDGLPLAQGPRYLGITDHGQENDNFSCYKQQAELLLRGISRGDQLAPSKMTIRLDHGQCFKKLAFHYLQDLHQEFIKTFDNSHIEKITRPYSFVKFDSIIGNIRKRYIDTRTQANLSKLSANRKQDLDIVTKHVSEILECSRQNSDQIPERILIMGTPPTPSSIWGSSRLQVIALKWTPITIIVVVAVVLLWASFILTDNFIISSL